MADRLKYTVDDMSDLIRQYGQMMAAQNKQYTPGYCTSCKDSKDMVVLGQRRHKNDAPSIYGDCPDCGQRIHVFQKREGSSAQRSSTK